MASHPFPPRGYQAIQYPLRHEFKYWFYMYGENTTKDSFITTLLATSRDSGSPETVEVNPAHANFVEDTGPRVFLNSIVPRMSVKISAGITGAAKNATTYPMKEIFLNWAPIYVAFKEKISAVDSLTGVQVSDIVELTKDSSTNEDVTPKFATVATGAGDQPVSNIVAPGDAFGDWNLGTDLELEPVAFDKQLYFDALKYYSVAGALRSVMPRMNTARLTHERDFNMFSKNFTNPTVKRGNPYTFCGILFHLPQVSQTSVDQVGDTQDVTDIGHVLVKVHVRFDEWNPEFDQTAV